MYDEQIKRLRDRAGAFDYDGRPDIACDYEKAADAIEELQRNVEDWKATAATEREAYWHWFDNYQRDVPKWIPVTERLPKNGVPILICGDGNVVEQGFFDDEYGYWYDWGGNRTFVHHWMPLPQPPKEEKIS